MEAEALFYTARDTLTYAKSQPLGYTMVNVAAEAVVGRLADLLPKASREALSHTLAYMEVESKSAGCIARRKMQTQAHLVSE